MEPVFDRVGNEVLETTEEKLVKLERVAVGLQDRDGTLEGLGDEIAHGAVHLPSGLLGEVPPRGDVLAGHLKEC